jgi:hypothetical protein
MDTADDSIELVLRGRFQPRIPIKTELGYKKLGAVKATKVHWEFIAPRCVLSAAARKKLLRTSRCPGVEFPVVLNGYSDYIPSSRPNSRNRIAESAVFVKCRSNHHGD